MNMTPEVTIVRPAPHGIQAHPREAPRLGVLGGMFNPITRAHLELGWATLHDFSLDEVLYVLPQMPPHKTLFGARLKDRLAMMQGALEPYEQFSIGLSQQGLFLEICQGLRLIYPEETRIYFVTGRDAAERILTWPYASRAAALHDMFACFELVVANRGQAFVLPPDPLLQPYAAKIHRQTLPDDFNWHSSTLVRERLRQRLEIRDLVPDAVHAYIHTHGLYVEE